ncbi:MAG TPA: hypothetical protein VFX17_01645 [Patescibacteria group bacterium]|nr:hypothetical protein [Patescibacteria group bacterium]
MSKGRKISFIIIVILAVACCVLWVVESNRSKTSPNTQQPTSMLDLAKTTPISTYHISGVVTAISGNNINFDATLIKDQRPVVYHITAVVSDSTPISLNNVAFGLPNKATLKSIKVGQTLDFSTDKYPYDQTQIQPTEIQIVQ